MKLKVCGMKFRENIEAVSALEPDYMGFIFYADSNRNFEEMPIEISPKTKKVGVFVNATFDEIEDKIKTHRLNVIQLHGDESDDFCSKIKQIRPEVEVWKAFHVDGNFDFSLLRNYQNADAILLDTKGKNYGGNGKKFDWNLLNGLNSEKDIILSGGISPDDWHEIQILLKEIPQIKIIDINSGFELSPGMKDVRMVKDFLNEIRSKKH